MVYVLTRLFSGRILPFPPGPLHALRKGIYAWQSRCKSSDHHEADNVVDCLLESMEAVKAGRASYGRREDHLKL